VETIKCYLPLLLLKNEKNPLPFDDENFGKSTLTTSAQRRAA
jgi:hypothetical protein